MLQQYNVLNHAITILKKNWKLVYIALITEGCFVVDPFRLLLFLVVFKLSSKNRRISGGGLDRSTTSLSSFISDPAAPKNRFVLSRWRSNRGGSRFSLNPCTIYGLLGSMDDDRTLPPLK